MSRIGGAFRTMILYVHKGYPKISFLSEIVLICCPCKSISYNFTRLVIFYLKHLNSKTLDVSMMNRDWSNFVTEFFIRWQFVILNMSQTSFMLMLYFVVIVTAVKHPNQWTVIKLYVKMELIKGSSSWCLQFYASFFNRS